MHPGADGVAVGGGRRAAAVDERQAGRVDRGGQRPAAINLVGGDGDVVGRASQETVTDDDDVAVAPTPVGTPGGVVSASVVPASAVDWSDALPTASRARTV